VQFPKAVVFFVPNVLDLWVVIILTNGIILEETANVLPRSLKDWRTVVKQTKNVLCGRGPLVLPLND